MSKFPRGVYFDVKRVPGGGWKADLRFAVTDGGTGFRVSGTDEGEEEPSAARAVKRAIQIADRLTSDPTVAAMLPPGTVLAMQTVKGIAKAAARGILGHKVNGKPLWKHFSGAFGSIARTLHQASEKKTAALSGGPLLLADRRDGEIRGC